MLAIFCPTCHDLILDANRCPTCGWQRPRDTVGIGEIAWVTDLGLRLIKPNCFPVVSAGVYCLGTENGTLLALDVKTGEIAWERSLGEKSLAHSLATDGVRLFVGCEDMNTLPSSSKALLALDLQTGEPLWQYPTQAHSLSAVTLFKGKAFFCACDGWFHALDAETGQSLWSVRHSSWAPAAPAAGEGIVCVGGRENEVVAYSTEEGSPRWRFSRGGWFDSRLSIDSERAYLPCRDGHLYTVDLQSGRLLWQSQKERGNGITSPPAAAGGRVFVGSRVYREVDGKQEPTYAMLALDAADGTEQWRLYAERHILPPPAIVEDTLFWGTNDGTLGAVDVISGQELWKHQFKSRIVTEPTVADDYSYFGGRDGMIYAIRWKAQPPEELRNPEEYEAQEQYAEAAVAYALRGDLEQAAVLYEDRLSLVQEAALLYEHAGQAQKAAARWQAIGDLQRARDLYREADDKVGLATILAQMGEVLQAARLFEEVGDPAHAAPLFAKAGDGIKAADLYYEAGLTQQALDTWSRLGNWEGMVNASIKQGSLVEAAHILEENGQYERAAEVYEEAMSLKEALGLRLKLEHWERVADLAQKVGDYVEQAQALERLGHRESAADAYCQAAEVAAARESTDPARIADLFEEAARLYSAVLHQDKRNVCRQQVRFYRRLPELSVQGQARDIFVEEEFNVLDLEVSNVGFGPAYRIGLALSENFETRRLQEMEGLPAGESQLLQVHARPRQGECGARVPLEIRVSYEDDRGLRTELLQVESVHVMRRGSSLLDRITPTTINIIGDVVEPGARKQVGDRVDIRRGEGRRVSIEGQDLNGGVTVRRGDKAVRRCPNCNLPIENEQARFCLDCGAPIDEDCG